VIVAIPVAPLMKQTSFRFYNQARGYSGTWENEVCNDPSKKTLDAVRNFENRSLRDNLNVSILVGVRA